MKRIVMLAVVILLAWPVISQETPYTDEIIYRLYKAYIFMAWLALQPEGREVQSTIRIFLSDTPDPLTPSQWDWFRTIAQALGYSIEELQARLTAELASRETN